MIEKQGRWLMTGLEKILEELAPTVQTAGDQAALSVTITEIPVDLTTRTSGEIEQPNPRPKPVIKDDVRIPAKESRTLSYAELSAFVRREDIEEGEIVDPAEDHANVYSGTRVSDLDPLNGSNSSEVGKSLNVKETNDINTNDILDKIIQEKVNKALDSMDKSSCDRSNILGKIRVEINGKDTGTTRNYKLEDKLNFDIFIDYLKSELRTRKLDYVLNETTHENVDKEKLTEDCFRVRDIIINHIDPQYYMKILNLENPIEIMRRLKELKRLETKTTTISAREDSYKLKYMPDKESASDFWDKFEEKIRIFENISDAGKINHEERRYLFFRAVFDVVPEI